MRSTNFGLKGGRLELGELSHYMPAIVLFIQLDGQGPKMAGD